MPKGYLNKEISMPIVIGIIIIFILSLVVLVGGYSWWQLSEIQRGTRSPEVKIPEKEFCKGNLEEDCESKRVKVIGIFRSSKGCTGALIAENYEGDESQNSVLFPEFAQKCQETEKYNGKKVEVIGIVKKEKCPPLAQCWGGVVIENIESIKIIDETADGKDCINDDDCLVFGEIGDCNCGCFNKNYQWQPKGICLYLAPVSCKCIDGECEEVF